ncbi:hypothetical protein BGZ98_010048 [Dissophora globulifera]|nr:hypothetical protein BGZ98_010048 [Dissophora globulifera]
MAFSKSQPQPRRPYSSSPPSPKINVKLSRANSDFYAAPTFEEPKRKSSSLLPSPTTLDAKPLPKEPSFASQNDGARHSNPNSPNVKLTMATPMQPHSTNSRLSLTLLRTDDEGDIFMDSEDILDQELQPFKVNPADIPNRPPSANNNLTESGQRGLAILKQLSTEGRPASREGSPVPTSRSSEESTRVFINRIDELNTLTTTLQVNLNDTLQAKMNTEAEHNKLVKAYEELAHQNQELQAKYAKRDRDYEVMSKNYLDHVRMIRATDDDHSTVIDRVTQLKASIEHLIRKAQGARSVNLKRSAAVDHFKKSGLLEAFPVPEDQLEPYHLNLYMESAVMSLLVASFFDKPLCSVFDYNEGFQDIYDWMFARNSKLAVRWRQQLCVMIMQDPETKTRQEIVVSAAATALTTLISEVYSNIDEGNKIRDICCKAFDLSVAMTSLESAISPVPTPLGTPFDQETMATSLKSNQEGNVALVIFPAFKDRGTFEVVPKVWCY